MIDLF